MANPNLFSTYSSRNMVVDTGLTINYNQQYNGEYWEVSRFARKSYSYVGMTEAAAYACAAAKRAQYTREYSRIAKEVPSGGGEAVVTTVPAICCAADIAPRHQSGDAWSCEISVNETDTKYSATKVTDMAAMFAAEDGRAYDGSGGGGNPLTLDTVTRRSGQAVYTYTQLIGGDFNPAGLVFQWKTSDATAEWNQGTTIPSDSPLYCRLMYGSIESNTITLE